MRRVLIRLVVIAACATLLYFGGFVCYDLGRAHGGRLALRREAYKSASPLYECLAMEGAESAVKQGLLTGAAVKGAIETERKFGKVLSWQVIHVDDFGDYDMGIDLMVVRQRGTRYESIVGSAKRWTWAFDSDDNL